MTPYEFMEKYSIPCEEDVMRLVQTHKWRKIEIFAKADGVITARWGCKDCEKVNLTLSSNSKGIPTNEGGRIACHKHLMDEALS